MVTWDLYVFLMSTSPQFAFRAHQQKKLFLLSHPIAGPQNRPRFVFRQGGDAGQRLHVLRGER